MNLNPNEPFHLYSIYYDLIYANKDYTLESEYVLKILEQYNIPIKSILELGSGTGNYAKIFCEKGLQVTGIEKSQQMLEKSAAKNILGFKPILADITNFDLNIPFDAIVSLFHVISYLTSTEDIIACFTNVAKHLNNNGIFIFDVWYSPCVYSQKAESRVKEVEDEWYKVTRHATPIVIAEENTIDVVYEIIITQKLNEQYHQLQETHKMRHFSTPEIAHFAKLAGLKLINSEEFLTANQPSIDTWGVCYTLQKI